MNPSRRTLLLGALTALAASYTEPRDPAIVPNEADYATIERTLADRLQLTDYLRAAQRIQRAARTVDTTGPAGYTHGMRLARNNRVKGRKRRPAHFS